jgi:hypothetical protein
VRTDLTLPVNLLDSVAALRELRHQQQVLKGEPSRGWLHRLEARKLALLPLPAELLGIFRTARIMNSSGIDSLGGSSFNRLPL